jgi:fatty-acyl-CoA synthase
MHENLGLGSWIARRARMAPDRPALVFGEQTQSYGSLDARITRLARSLESRGVGAGDRIAFLGRNHPASLELLFACGLLGAVFVPLHPGFDARALVQVLRETEPVALVVTPELLDTANRLKNQIDIRLRFTTGVVADAAERFEDLIEAGSDEPMDRAIGLDDLCLLAFSSGTTGPNKGVCLTHGNLLFNALNTLSALDYRSDDVIVTSAPLYRMGGLGFTLAMLFKGGTAVLQERADPELSLRLIEQRRVTILFDSVGVLEAMRASPAFESADLSSLRIIVTGGSHVPPRLVDAFRRRGLRLQPGYGLTEASPLVLIVSDDEVERHPGAAGRPLFYTDVRVVDGELEDVAPGEIGELMVRGPNVMRGYWRDPAATQRALVGGWLRTGDAAHATADGMVTIVGRVADALVLGGRRIHPALVEDELRERGDVLEAAIVQLAANEDPVAFVVPAGDGHFDADELLELCERGLGRRPSLIRVSELPKNPNGKILRAELRVRAQQIRSPALASGER